ncbi:peptidoglycan bridge formation glycyltransferase FemA/FemB family protein [Patescibacteria group bacterium]|nr:peptidoglycan bridge formation glycyltransferase FemA/FemB family protein [Patescibacteria group bacterium]
MEIKVLENKESWEDFLGKTSPQSLFQAWIWGEIRKKLKKHGLATQDFIRLGTYEKNNLIGIAQIEKVRAKRGTFLHIRHGPVMSSWNSGNIKLLLDYLKSSPIGKGVRFIRISPLIENSKENQKLLKSQGFIDAPIHRMDGEICWVLDIDKDEMTLLSGMRKTTRYLIKQGEKMGIRIEKSRNQSDMKFFMEIYKKTAHRQRFVPHQGIEEEFSEMLKEDKILLFKGLYDNKLLAVALIVFYNNQAIYHHSASLDSKIPVNYLLQWEAIREARRRGMKQYNFWGIAPENNNRHPWKGLTLFKKGFGGRIQEYIHAKDIPLSPLYCATYAVELTRKILKGY